MTNRVPVISLVQWLGWVFENKERKKETTGKVENTFAKVSTAPFLQYNNLARSGLVRASRWRVPPKYWHMSWGRASPSTFVCQFFSPISIFLCNFLSIISNLYVNFLIYYKFSWHFFALFFKLLCPFFGSFSNFDANFFDQSQIVILFFPIHFPFLCQFFPPNANYCALFFASFNIIMSVFPSISNFYAIFFTLLCLFVWSFSNFVIFWINFQCLCHFSDPFPIFSPIFWWIFYCLCPFFSSISKIGHFLRIFNLYAHIFFISLPNFFF